MTYRLAGLSRENVKLQQPPMVTMQGRGQPLGVDNSNDPLAAFHLANMPLRNTRCFGKLHLRHSFPVPIA